jgi:murein DD-endopeptidase MepM/ murein hydrolase activator NlpD
MQLHAAFFWYRILIKVMAKIIYYYDTETSEYRRVYRNPWMTVLKLMGITVVSLGLAVGMVVTYLAYFEVPSEIKLKNDIKELEFHFDKLNRQLLLLTDAIQAVEKRDDDVYRTVLGIDPIDKAVRNGGVGGVDRYEAIRESDSKYADTYVDLYSKVDRLRRKLYIESKSQDELFQLAEDKQKLNASIPAIQPISNKKLTALASGFGMRIHPIYNVLKMHTGVDFGAPLGTPVYATADGVVVQADTAVLGYGYLLVVDHGYGYHTRYAHLSGFTKKPGDRVKRGEQIAMVGNSGLSTAPHLHYEVLLRGTHTNPVHYFFNDLNPNDYEKIIALASVQNKSLGN